MPKNIVICSDGTGNTANKDRGTNVFKFYEAVDIHGYRSPSKTIPEQLAYYDDGVGVGTSLPVRILGKAFGLGLTRSVKNLYTSLSRVYEKDDRIYLIGFSRGAFTVRTLAGFILCCGIPIAEKYETDDRLRKAVDKAYERYRQRYRRFWQRVETMPICADEEFGETKDSWGMRYKGVPIRFIGVWDTVDAVGMPFRGLADFWDRVIYPFRFQDRKLVGRVERACHAVSIDDERQTFHPTMWDEHNATTGQVEQVWFSGVHSNVGGGYPKQGMSLVTLDWMMAQAEKCGLRFIRSDRNSVRARRDVHDKLYDSRAGLGIYYRWKPREIAEICGVNACEPKIHVSVFERIAHQTSGYAPAALPRQFLVVGTPGSGGPSDLKEIQNLVCGALSHGIDQQGKEQNSSGVRAGCQEGAASLLQNRNMEKWVRIGKASYYGFLILTLAALYFGLKNTTPNLDGLSFTTKIGKILEWGWSTCSSLSTLWTILKETWPWFLPGVALVYVASLLVDNAMGRYFSAFWHDLRRELHDVLEPPPKPPTGERTLTEVVAQGQGIAMKKTAGQ